MSINPDYLASALGEELALLDCPAAKKTLRYMFDDHKRPIGRRRLDLLCMSKDAPIVYHDRGSNFAVVDNAVVDPIGT